MKTVFCIAEDRNGAEIGIQLAILSLAEHCPESDVIVYRPQSQAGFPEWLTAQRNCTLVTVPLPGANGWNCKPHALLATLAKSDPGTQVIWIDSDLIVTRNLAALLAQQPPEVLTITQEPLSAPHQGSEIRTRGWGLPIGRRFSESLNSCVVRTTHHHISLLLDWRRLLADAEYTRRAKERLDQKPPHLWSDQDVLAGLLGSVAYHEVPVQILRHGADVLHTGGGLAFSLVERFRGLFHPIPTVLHAIGVKPWVLLGGTHKEPGWFPWFRRLMQETSEYVIYVRRYRAKIPEPMSWTTVSTPIGRITNLLSFGHWALRGLPITAVCSIIRLLRPS